MDGYNEARSDIDQYVLQKFGVQSKNFLCGWWIKPNQTLVLVSSYLCMTNCVQKSFLFRMIQYDIPRPFN